MSEKKVESKAFGTVFSGAMSLFNTVAETAKAAKLDSSAEEIPYEDLMHLCMKMNKRMQMLEAKIVETMKNSKTLHEERSALLEMLQLVIKVPPAIADESINIPQIKDQWMEYLNQQRQQTEKYELSLRRLNQQSPVLHATEPQDSTGEGTEALRVELEEVQRKYEAAIAELESFRRSSQEHVTALQQKLTSRQEELNHVKQQMESMKTAYEEQIIYLQLHKVKAAPTSDDGAGEQTSLQELQQQYDELNEKYEEKLLQQSKVHVKYERLKEKLADMDRNHSALLLLKAEQEGLIASLKKDLKATLSRNEDASRRIKEYENYKAQAEAELVTINNLKEKLAAAEQASDATRLLLERYQKESQQYDTNVAIKASKIANLESTIDALRKDLHSKEVMITEYNERIGILESRIKAHDARLAERVEDFNTQLKESAAHYEELLTSKNNEISELHAKYSNEIESINKDASKKSSVARLMISERDEEIRQLQAKISNLEEEINSGAPNERRIFELAQLQAKREMNHGISRDSREMAFQRLQATLESKDLELAKLQQAHGDLVSELVELRRVKKRENINMDYLKNVILQYMSFAPTLPERAALVPVIATLLQFDAKEMKQVNNAMNSSFSSRTVKEVKLHPSSRTMGHLDNSNSRADVEVSHDI